MAKKKRKSRAKHPGGRPPIYRKDTPKIVQALYATGKTDAEVAKILGVATGTIWRWAVEKAKFREARKKGKEIVNDAVEASLFQRATGYSHPDTYFSSFQGEVTATKTVKHYPPDTTAAIFWLKNRRPAEWRDRTELDAKIEGHQTISHEILQVARVIALEKQEKLPENNDQNGDREGGKPELAG